MRLIHVGFVVFVLVLNSGCGNKFVENISVRAEDEILLLDTKLDKGIKFNIGGRYPITELPGGFVEFVQGGGNVNAHVVLGVDLNDIGSNIGIGTVTGMLPTGASLPDTVKGKMLAIPVRIKELNNVIVYIGVKDLELGIEFPIPQLDIMLPIVKFTKEFKDKAGIGLFDATVYGPAKIGLDTSNVIVHGGIFIHASFRREEVEQMVYETKY